MLSINLDYTGSRLHAARLKSCGGLSEAHEFSFFFVKEI